MKRDATGNTTGNVKTPEAPQSPAAIRLALTSVLKTENEITVYTL